MITIKTLLFVLVSLCLKAFADKCLDSSQPQGKCTECQPANFLFQGKCYEKIRGCLEHKISGKSLIEISCILCQNGYVADESKCQRQAIIELRKGFPIQVLNNPSPLRSDNPGKLQKQNIKQVEDPNKVPEKSPQPKIKMPPKFPEIKLAQLRDETSFNEKYEQIASDLQNLINGLYPELANEHCFKFLPSDVEGSQGKYLLVFEQGTILVVDKVVLKGSNNIRSIAQGSETYQYMVMKLGQSKNVKNLLSFFKSRKIGDFLSTKFGINLEIKTKDPQNKGYYNLNLLSGDITPIQTQDQSQRISSFLQTKKKQYEKLLEQAYLQFLKKIIVLNVPQNIVDVKVYQNDKETQIIFKVIYSISNQLETQYSVFKYKIDKNQTEVLGYFIQGSNVLGYFNTSYDTSTNMTHTANWTNSTFNQTEIQTSDRIEAEAAQKVHQTKSALQIIEKNDTQNITSRQPARNENFSTANQSITKAQQKKDQPLVPKNQAIDTKIQVKSNNTEQKKQIQPKETKESLQKQQIITPTKIQFSNSTPNLTAKPEVPKQTQNLSAEVKSLNDIIEIMKAKPQFNKKIEKGYKVITFQGQTSQNKAQITYKLRVFISSGLTLIKIAENVETKQYIQTYMTQSTENCVELAEGDSVFIKLDNLIKKSYPILQSFNKSSGQFKLEQNNQKFLIIYSNEQSKKVFYEITKGKDSGKYSITKSGMHESGFCFQKKDMESINLKMSDFQESKYDRNSNIKLIKLALSELVQRFRPYVYNSTVQAALTNSTHMKIYISNKLSTFEFLFKADQVFGKATLNLVDKKYGYDVWPVGVKKALLTNADAINYQKIEDAVLRKYKYYFGNATNEIFIKKSANEQFQIAFKTLFGYFSLSVTVRSEAVLGLLKKSSDIDEWKVLTSCPTGQYLDTIDKKCYQKVSSCYKQLGNICLSCDVGFTLQASMKECRRACLC